MVWKWKQEKKRPRGPSRVEENHGNKRRKTNKGRDLWRDVEEAAIDLQGPK